MEQLIIVSFLKSFFILFNARIEKYKVVDEKIFGTISWYEEGDDLQDFVFNLDFNDLNLNRIKVLCDFLHKNSFVVGDCIIISEIDLLKALFNEGWNEVDAAEAINCLCSLEVKMLDEGEETDSFFVHF